jgi:hypothetical protein
MNRRESDERQELLCHGIDEKSFRLNWALSGPLKTGQQRSGQKPANGSDRDYVLLTCRLLRWQVRFCAPTARSAFEHVTVVEKTVEHDRNCGAVPQQLAPVLYRSIRGEQCTDVLIASHHHLKISSKSSAVVVGDLRMPRSSKRGLLLSPLHQAITATIQLIRDPARKQVNRWHGFGLSLSDLRRVCYGAQHQDLS